LLLPPLPTQFHPREAVVMLAARWAAAAS
jgi:hypothetical protein